MHIAEESGPPGARWQQKRECDFSSSEEINSDEGDDVMSFEGMLPLWRHNPRVSDMAEDRGATGGVAGLEAERTEDDHTEGATERDDNVRAERGGSASTKPQTGARTTSGTVDGTEDVSGGIELLTRGDGGRRHSSADWPQGPASGAEGAGCTGGSVGQSSGHDSKDKACPMGRQGLGHCADQSTAHAEL